MTVPVIGCSLFPTFLQQHRCMHPCSCRISNRSPTLSSSLRDTALYVYTMGANCTLPHALPATQDERLRAQKAAERVAAVKALQAEMRDRATLLRELRTTSNRGVERAHTRLAREHSKANQDAAPVAWTPSRCLFPN